MKKSIKTPKDRLKIYYARAMDGIKPSEILEDDFVIKTSFNRKELSLVNPYREQKLPTEQAEQLVENNVVLLKESDLLLANLSRQEYVYFGVIFEMVQAVNLGIPTVAYIGNSNLKNRYYLHSYCDFICNTIDEAIEYIWRCWSYKGINVQIKEEKAFYDQVADSYKKIGRKTYIRENEESHLYDKERKFLKEKIIDYCRNRDVLELGCGTGYWTKSIVEVARSVICIDSSQNMITKAKEKLKNSLTQPNFIHGDFLDRDLSIKPCDVIVSYFAISFLPKLIQEQLLSAIKKWTKRDGYILFAENNKIPTIPSIGLGHRRIQSREVDRKRYIIYKEYFTQNQLRNFLEINGFKVIDSLCDTCWFTFCAAINKH